MKKMINKTHIEGLLYESTLEERIAGAEAKNPGAKYISGKISVQVAEDNIITIDIYESAITKAGANNKKYPTVVQLISSPTVVANGIDAAIKVKVDSALAASDFPDKRTGEMISTFKNSGGFINIVSTVTPSATFETDILITSTTDEMVKNDDGDMEPTGALVINGLIFDFASRVIPVKFTIENPNGVEYFRNLEQNTFTKVWGNMITQEVKTTKIEESAFGDDKVVEFVSSKKKYVVTGVNKVPYDFGSEEILTVQEVQGALADRNVYLAEQKARAEANKNAPAKAAAPIAQGASNTTFNF